MMNSDLNKLQPYPFTKMAKLLSSITPNPKYNLINLGIGEPQHLPPKFVLNELKEHVQKVQNYPTTDGINELSTSIKYWLKNRFKLDSINNKQVAPVMGTREAIFSFVQASINQTNTEFKPIVIMPNPFYQIYEGATILAKAEPYYLPCLEDNNFNPDYTSIPEPIWQQTQLVFVCSPNNPTGSVMSLENWTFLLKMSDKYEFIIASDECYSELYFENPPIGLLEACCRLKRNNYQNCIVFHSLSKRSNLPGLRSGFIAGNADLIENYMQYRTYQGCSMPLHHQYASIKAWQDEAHVEKNRQLYRKKFELWHNEFKDSLELKLPDAGFYLWIKVPEKFKSDDEYFVCYLFEKLNIHALAGQYLSRNINGFNPGKGYIRLALVSSIDENIETVSRIKTIL